MKDQDGRVAKLEAEAARVVQVDDQKDGPPVVLYWPGTDLTPEQAAEQARVREWYERHGVRPGPMRLCWADGSPVASP